MRKFDWTNSSLARWVYVLLTRDDTTLLAFTFMSGLGVGTYFTIILRQGI